jgi:hypothetical protein
MELTSLRTKDFSFQDKENSRRTMVSAMQKRDLTQRSKGIRYKTVWSCLLLLEMVMSNIAAAAHFQSLALM